MLEFASLPTQVNNTVSKLTQANVIVGMSGGVDSSVAAFLLIEQGYQVEGLFMKNWEEDDGTEYCTAINDLADAQAVCDRLAIPLRVANFAAEYWDGVFEEFLQDYKAGRTPNPDVLCNREIKFKHFTNYAQTLGADFIATGHYARRVTVAGSMYIAKAKDTNKDQSYFLQAVPKHAFENCLFPLGELKKPAVRALAKQVGLHNHERKDSTGICFIGERRFDDFLARYIAKRVGDILDTQGRKLGQHNGVHNFTVGQRQGLNIGGLKNRAETPWYVVAKASISNRLVVSQNLAMLEASWLRASQPNWLQEVALPLHCSAKIRYRQSDQACRVSAATDGSLLVQFSQAQRAIASGQFIAFYDGENLLGGAKITAAPQKIFQLSF